jgi:hypothetical protein
MNSIPFVPTSSDWAIIIGCSLVIAGALIWAIVYGLVKLARFVGWKAFVGFLVIAAVILLAGLTVLGR